MATYYVIDSNKNKVEALDKQGTYDLLAEAIKEGKLPSYDGLTAFVTKIKGSDDGLEHELSFVTQARYNELQASGGLRSNCYYFITDDTTAEDLESAIAKAKEEAVAEAKESASEGLAKKLDKGDWVEYQFNYVKDTNIKVPISLDEGTYICEIVAQGTGSYSDNKYHFFLGVVSLDAGISFVGTRIFISTDINDISVYVNKKEASIWGNADGLMPGEATYNSYIRFRKIAND